MFWDSKLQWQKYFKEIIESIWTSRVKIRGKIKMTILCKQHNLSGTLSFTSHVLRGCEICISNTTTTTTNNNNIKSNNNKYCYF